MLIKENIKINNKDFIKQYSDKDVLIQNIKTKELYVEAIDPIEFEREYVETDIPIKEVVEVVEE